MSYYKIGFIVRLAAFLLAALAGFSASSLAIHMVLRAIVNPLRLYAEIRSEKLALIDSLAPDVTIAAFGSSHVHVAFDPRVFDKALGSTTEKSANLAVAGGSQTEQRVMAIAFLKHLQQEGVRRCTIILELNAGLNFQPRYLIHPRTINLYDWKTVSFVCSYTDREKGLKKYLGRMGFGLIGGGLHYLSVGMLSSAIFSVPLNNAVYGEGVGDNKLGVDILSRAKNPTDPEVANIFAVRPNFPSVEPDSVDPGNAQLLRELANVANMEDIRFFYVVTPVLSDMNATFRYPASMPGPYGSVPIIDLAAADSPFFKEDLWHDPTHMNDKGAALFSLILGEKIKQLQGRR